MELTPIEVYSSSTNAAVVRMPGRQFPGIVIQGDSLKGMLDLAREITILNRDSIIPELTDLCIELEDLLKGYLCSYEKTLNIHNCSLPYPK